MELSVCSGRAAPAKPLGQRLCCHPRFPAYRHPSPTRSPPGARAFSRGAGPVAHALRWWRLWRKKRGTREGPVQLERVGSPCASAGRPAARRRGHLDSDVGQQVANAQSTWAVPRLACSCSTGNVSANAAVAIRRVPGPGNQQCLHCIGKGPLRCLIKRLSQKGVDWRSGCR